MTGPSHDKCEQHDRTFVPVFGDRSFRVGIVGWNVDVAILTLYAVVLLVAGCLTDTHTRLFLQDCEDFVGDQGAREPWGQEGQTTPGNLPGGQIWYYGILTPIFWKQIFSRTHPHGTCIIIILYSETRSRTVFFYIILTGLRTTRNVALMIWTPLSKKQFACAC